MEKIKNLYSIKKKYFNENRKVINKNVILTYDYNENNEPEFSIGEIIDKENGVYVLFKNQKIIVGQPFSGYAMDIDKKYKVYDEFTGEEKLVDGAYYEDIPRNDNIVYSIVNYMYTSRQSFAYPVVDNFYKFNRGEHLLRSHKLHIGDIEKEPFTCFYNDKNFLFSGGGKPLSLWLEFEKDFNQLYKHYLHTGENYLKRDEEVVLKAIDKFKKENEDMIKRSNKMFTGSEKTPDGTITESLIR